MPYKPRIKVCPHCKKEYTANYNTQKYCSLSCVASANNARRRGKNYAKTFAKEQEIITAAAEVYSMAELLRKLGLKAHGGNYDNMKRKLQQLNVDTSHWRGAAWSRDQQLKDWSNYTNSSRLKPHLIKIRGHVCECCKLERWLDSPITLEVHHIDGDRTNNDITNLQLLCPNCHSVTDSWKGRNKNSKKTG